MDEGTDDNDDESIVSPLRVGDTMICYYYYFRRYLLMLICFICIWVGCIKGIGDKILFNPISFYASFFFSS